MPIGGETVGTAYIRILADGGDLDQSIRDQFDAHDKEIRTSGDRNAETYKEGVIKNLRSAPTKKEFERALFDAFVQHDGNKMFREFENGTFKDFQKRLEDQYGVLGKRLGKKFDHEMSRGMTFDELRNRLKNITKEIALVEDEMHTEAIRINDRVVKEIARRQKEDIKRVHSNFELISNDIERFARGERTLGSRHDLLTHLRNLDGLARRTGQDTHEWGVNMERLTERLLFANPVLERSAQRVRLFADSVGAGFGRGARNDFINFFGAVVRGFAMIPAAPILLLDKMADSVRRVGLVFGNARRSGLDPFTATLSTIGTIGNKALNGLIALGTGFAAVSLLVGSAVAVFSQLIGVITALASTLGFGIVGGLGALVGALGPAVVGVGVLASAFIGLDKGAKAVAKHDFKPVVDAFHELQAQARIPIFANLERQGRSFGQVVQGWAPLFREVGQSISNVGDYFLRAMHSVGFLQFQASMTTFLPHAVESLGKSFGNALGGIGGLFRAMIPLTEDFLSWLQRITGEFAAWANSDVGQGKLRNFFDDAGKSAQELGGFLGAVTRLLAAILDQGRATGDSLFGSMTRSIDAISDRIRANPDLLRGWFDSAREFGHVLGDLIHGVGALFDALDNPTTRAAANTILQGFAAAFLAVSHAINSLGPIIGSFVGKVIGATIVFVKLRGAVAGSIGALTGYAGAAGRAGAASATLGAGTGRAVTRMSILSNAARTAAGVGGILALVGASQASSKSMEHLGSVAGFAALGFSVGGPWGAAIGGAVGLLKGLFDQTKLTASVQAELSSAADEVAGSLDQMTGAVTRNTVALARKKLADTGAFDAAQHMGVNLDDLTQAYLGNEAAIRRVGHQMQTGWNKRMREGGDAVNGLSGDVNKLNGTIDTGRSKFNAARRHINQVRLAADQAAERTGKLGGAFHDAQDRASSMGQAMDRLARKKPRPSVQLIDKASRVMNGIDKQLKLLGDRRPKPVATLIDKATKLSNIVMSHLDELGRKHPSPKVLAEVGDALRKLAAVRAAIAAIHDKTVSIRTQRIVYNAQGAKNRADIEANKPGASGGLFEGVRGIGIPMRIGEAGREALVPLDRPLSLVDPAVRQLSAIAQGLKMPRMASGGIAGGKTLSVTQHIYTPNTDPRAAAASVVNQLAVVGGY